MIRQPNEIYRLYCLIDWRSWCQLVTWAQSTDSSRCTAPTCPWHVSPGHRAEITCPPASGSRRSSHPSWSASPASSSVLLPSSWSSWSNTTDMKQILLSSITRLAIFSWKTWTTSIYIPFIGTNLLEGHQARKSWPCDCDSFW